VAETNALPQSNSVGSALYYFIEHGHDLFVLGTLDMGEEVVKSIGQHIGEHFAFTSEARSRSASVVVLRPENLESSKSDESWRHSQNYRTFFMVGISIIKFIAHNCSFVRYNHRSGSSCGDSQVVHSFRAQELTD